MDKPRHPHVVRTWTVERTKIFQRPQPPKIHSNKQQSIFRPPDKTPRAPGSEPKGQGR
jgi:hypothetical protein